jgi:transposase-like protein
VIVANRSYTPEKVAEVVAFSKEHGAKAAAAKHDVSYQTVLRWASGPTKKGVVRKRPGQAAPEAAVSANGTPALIEAYQKARANLDAAKAALVAAL